MCTAAYRAALTQDFSSSGSSGSSVPVPVPVPSRCHVTEAEADREGVAEPPVRRRMKLRQNGRDSRGVAAAAAEAESGPARKP
jgi:hypothetical protein